MKLNPWRSRKYPIIRDEDGQSSRQQAFQLFNEGYRPMQIFHMHILPVPRNTLLRYYEDWKKQNHKISDAQFKRYLKASPELSQEYVNMLAEYFGVPEEEIIVRMQKPWGISSLSKGELPDRRLFRIQSKVERRLELALRFIYLGEHVFKNNPKQIGDLINEALFLKNGTRLIIDKTDGQIVITKQKHEAPITKNESS